MTPVQVVTAAKGDVKQLPPDKRPRIKALDMVNGADGTFTEGKLRLQVTFTFDTRTNGLVCINYVVQDKAQNELLRERMTQLYGEPENVSGLPAIGMQSFSWRKPDEIDLDLVKDQQAYVLHCAPEP